MCLRFFPLLGYERLRKENSVPNTVGDCPSFPLLPNKVSQVRANHPDCKGPLSHPADHCSSPRTMRVHPKAPLPPCYWQETLPERSCTRACRGSSCWSSPGLGNNVPTWCLCSKVSGGGEMGNPQSNFKKCYRPNAPHAQKRIGIFTKSCLNSS